MFRGPVSPKAHGAWLGAGSGISLGSIVVGLIESYLTHKALPLPLITLIEGVCTVLASYAGAWLMPLLNGLKTKEVADRLAEPPALIQFGSSPPTTK